MIAVPDSPDRRTTITDNGHDVVHYEVHKVKSESPELATSVHEYPSSGPPNGTQNTASNEEAVEDPIISSLANSNNSSHPAPLESDQRAFVPSSSEVEERTVPKEILRRSPFLHRASRAAHAKARRPESPRKRSLIPDDSLASRHASKQQSQVQEGIEQPLSPGAPLEAPVSKPFDPPLHVSKPRGGDNYGESLVSGIQKELLAGPRSISDAGEAIEPSMDTTNANVDHDAEEARDAAQMPPPSMIRRPGEPSLREALARKVPSSSKVDSRTGNPAREVAETIILEETEDESTIAPLKTTGRSTPKKPDVWTIPSDTDDSVVVQRRRKSHSLPNKLNIEAVTTGQKAKMSGAADKKNHGSIEDMDEHRVNLDSEAERQKQDRAKKDKKNARKRELTAEKKAREANLAAQLEADEAKDLEDRQRKQALEANAKQQKAEPKHAKKGRESSSRSAEPEVISERPISEREKKEREKIKKQEAAAKRLEAKEAGQQKARDAKASEEQERSIANREPAPAQKDTDANAAKRSKTPSTISEKEQETGESGASKLARPEGKVSAPNEARGPVRKPSKEEAKKGKVDRKRPAPDAEASEEPKVKKTRSTAEDDADRTKRAQRQATAEAETAAREADAIARVQKSVGSPSSKSATKRTPKPERIGMLQEARKSWEASKTNTPSKPMDAPPKRRSMTPLFPSSTTRQPIKSALRTGETLSRRSVSFNDDPIALQSPTRATTKAAMPQGFNNGSSNVQSTKSSGGPRSDEPPSSPSDRASKRHRSVSATQTQSQRPSMSKSTTSSVEAGSKPKKQTKLNVIRDVKMKGHAGDPPVAKKPVTPTTNGEVEVISSDSEKSASTFYSDEEDRPRPAKAGPSSKKKKLSNSMRSGDEATPPVATPSIDGSKNKPKSRYLDGANGNTESPATPSANSDRGTQRLSMSRSPAQYVSRTDSASSRSGSEKASPTASGSGSGSGSASESRSESEYESEEDAQTSANGAPEKLDRSINGNLHAKHDKAQTVKQPMRSARSRSATPENSDASEESETEEEERQEEDLAYQMEQQLQRDCRQSTEPQSLSQPALPRAKQEVRKFASTQPTASENSKARFPSLTGLKKQPSKDTVTAPPAKASESSTKSKGIGHPSAPSGSMSSSESDEESSSSEDNVDETTQSAHNGAKEPSSYHKGVNRLIKRTLFFLHVADGKH